MLEEAKSPKDLELVLKKLELVSERADYLANISASKLSLLCREDKDPEPQPAIPVDTNMAPLFHEMYRRLDAVERLLDATSNNINRVQI